MVSKLDYRIEDKLNTHTLAGIILILIGLFAIFYPLYFAYSFIYVFGAFLIILGLIEGFLYLTTQGEDKMRIVGAIFMLSLGLLDIISPVLGLKALTSILILFFLFAAFSNFMLARSIKSQVGAGLAVLNGILTLIFDAFLILGWHSQLSFAFIGILIGVFLTIDGVIFLSQGLFNKHRKIKK